MGILSYEAGLKRAEKYEKWRVKRYIMSEKE